MKGSGLLALAMVAILLAVPVSGQVHHEDYEKAKLNLDSIKYFLATTKEDINRTLEALLVEDIPSALSHCGNFTEHVERIGETLEKIPPEIDSYAELSLYYDGLAALDGNLSELVQRASEVLGAVGTASNFTIHHWNVSVVRGALETLDWVLLNLPGTVSGLGTSLSNVDRDLRMLQEDGLYLDNQILLILDVSEHYSGIDMEWIVPGIARDTIVLGLIGPWAQELYSFRTGIDPEASLRERLDLLSAVTLRSALSGVVASIVRDYREASGSMEVLFDLFRDIEEQRGLLEGVYRYRIEGQYEVFRSAQENLVSISDELLLQRTVLGRYPDLDDGSVDENLTALERRLAALREWFDSLTLFEDDLQALSDLMSAILDLQVHDPDIDNDGNLSLEEGHDLVMDILAVSLLGNMTTMRDALEEEILSIQGPLFDRYMPVFSVLNETSARVTSFTTSHDILIEELVFLTDPETSGEDELNIGSYTRAAGAYLRMDGALGWLSEANLSLQGTNVTFDNGPIGPLEALLELYHGLLLLVSMGRNLTGLYLELDRDTVPYASEVRARVLIVERDLEGVTRYPDGETVRMFLDNMNLTNLTTRRGSAIFSFPIGSDLGTGVHTISASYMPENGTYLNRSADFMVRKINTVTKVFSDVFKVEPVELFPIDIIVRDEYGRPVPGNITVLESNYTTDGNLSVDISIEGFGDRWLQVSFHGDQWFSPSYGWKLFNVSTDPVLELFLENDTLFRGDPLNFTVRIVHGSGNLIMELDGIDLAPGSDNTTIRWLDVMGGVSGDEPRGFINTTNLSIGVHSLSVHIVTNVSWVRSGPGPRVLFNVLERPPAPEVPEEPEEPEPPEEEEPPEEPEKQKSEFVRILQIVGTIVVILLVAFTLVLLVVRSVRTKETPKFVVPRRKRRKAEGAEGDVLEPYEKNQMDIDLEKAAEVLPGERMDPNRVRVVASYLEAVDRAPENIGVKRTDTPREANGKFVSAGADRSVSNELTEGFEKALYRDGKPSSDDAERVRRSASQLVRWFEGADGEKNNLSRGSNGDIPKR